MPTRMPGLLAPAFLILSAALAAVPAPVSAQQQAQPSVLPPASQVPVPGQLELSKMLWSTLAAVDHANRSGNYSVLRDMSSQGFQINNTSARLAEVFASLRNSRIDLANTLLVPPTYIEPPTILQQNVLQVRGVFQLRPTSIYFDVYYTWEQGMWKLHGIDIRPAQMLEAMPDPVSPGPAAPPPSPEGTPPPRG